MLTPQEAKQLPKFKPNPLFKDLPAYLKDPKNFNFIQGKLLNCLAGRHSHSEMVDWASCVTCQNKMTDLRNEINKLGFTSAKQYYEWKKVMDMMINQKPLPLK